MYTGPHPRLERLLFLVCYPEEFVIVLPAMHHYLASKTLSVLDPQLSHMEYLILHPQSLQYLVVYAAFVAELKL